MVSSPCIVYGLFCLYDAATHRVLPGQARRQGQMCVRDIRPAAFLARGWPIPLQPLPMRLVRAAFSKAKAARPGLLLSPVRRRQVDLLDLPVVFLARGRPIPPQHPFRLPRRGGNNLAARLVFFPGPKGIPPPPPSLPPSWTTHVHPGLSHFPPQAFPHLSHRPGLNPYIPVWSNPGNGYGPGGFWAPPPPRTGHFVPF